MTKLNSYLLFASIIIILITCLVFGLRFLNQSNNTLDLDNGISSGETSLPIADNMQTVSNETDLQVIELDNSVMSKVNEMIFTRQVRVWNNMVKGATHRGISFPSDLTGSLGVKFEGEKFNLKGKFSGLPDPISGDFYEGWLVQKSPFAFVSTGKLLKSTDGTYENYYVTATDYLDYSYYVLTLESVDGDASPEIHIIEGDIQ